MQDVDRQTIRAIISCYPAVVPLLDDRTRYIVTVLNYKYDPDQPRDEHGQWSDSGGGSSGGGSDGGGDSGGGGERETIVEGISDPRKVDMGWNSSVSEDERAVVHNYTTGGYVAVNQALRDGDTTLVDNAIGKIDSVIEKAGVMDEPVTVFRGVNNIPDPPGSLTAGVFGADADKAKMEWRQEYAKDKFPIGSTVEDAAFQSTSFIIEPALDRSKSGVVFQIETNHGAYLNHAYGLSSYDDEYELLLPRGTSYTVKDVSTKTLETLDEQKADRIVVTVEAMK
jgi:hypothetical protein